MKKVNILILFVLFVSAVGGTQSGLANDYKIEKDQVTCTGSLRTDIDLYSW